MTTLTTNSQPVNISLSSAVVANNDINKMKVEESGAAKSGGTGSVQPMTGVLQVGSIVNDDFELLDSFELDDNLPELVICESDNNDGSSDASSISDNDSTSSLTASPSAQQHVIVVNSKIIASDKKSSLATIVSENDEVDIDETSLKSTEQQQREQKLKDEEQKVKDEEMKKYNEALSKFVSAIKKSEESRNSIISQFGWCVPKTTAKATKTNKKSKTSKKATAVTTKKSPGKESIKIPAASRSTPTKKTLKKGQPPSSLTIPSATATAKKTTNPVVSPEKSIVAVHKISSQQQQIQSQRVQKQVQQQVKQVGKVQEQITQPMVIEAMA